MRRLLRIALIAAALIYPALMFCFLVVWKIPVRIISLCIVGIGALYFLAGTSKGGLKKAGTRLVSAAALLGVGTICLVTNSALVLKLYPLIINGVMLIFFASTLFFPPALIFRFATLQDRSIRGSLAEKRVEAYCKKVTLVWCGFFILNGCAAGYTIFAASDAFWSIYNGGISYLLIGILFAGEYIVRKMTDKKMPKAYPLSAFRENSREKGTILSYEGAWGSGRYKTWGDFLEDTAKLRLFIRDYRPPEGGESPEKWLLHVEDCWLFLVALTAALQCKKTILLTANISPAYIREIRGQDVPFLTDQALSEPSLFLPNLLANAPAPPAEDLPIINPDETRILMYTSGTTGRPKAVEQRLTEFEQDNRFVLSQWGEEALKRKLVSTVSQHHIYGLLFSILLPFTAGVPFRRTRLEFPEEFESLTDASYLIITVPAFLKRACGALDNLKLLDPWIFTSGGVLTPELAGETNKVFGFWPLEVYGSTETSGIAYRQSKNGLAWTPFDNAEIRRNDEGRLVVKSPYIKDPQGFLTGDLIEMTGDGKFLLQGRADSIVKIEEKRISLPEVESRILQSGLAEDVCVVALEDRRQYLAAAIVFNDAGRELFQGWEKYRINSYFSEYLLQYLEHIALPKKWRYLDALPTDVQGKKKKGEIEALFQTPDKGGNAGGEVPGGTPSAAVSGMRTIPEEKVVEKTADRVVLEFPVPQDCDYFDGHFPGFQLLPAVAQFEMAIRLASRYFGTPLAVGRIKRIKFSNIIYPDSTLRAEITYREGKGEISFKFSNPEGDRVYSSGSAVLPSGNSPEGGLG